ncbi:hypothetical protein QBC34DRAFT_479169 [Podospora aff. communis PSN243]|uniref:Uncharacterized protein n=1 Tax=Podospora aff. communis PSN243 TaxID=3040156 RepID=A0AAV9G695_9PEZI|nr:hypothetical protein QBC34DRAFT_479169 [Podospora aff. communis PSN243]
MHVRSVQHSTAEMQKNFLDPEEAMRFLKTLMLSRNSAPPIKSCFFILMDRNKHNLELLAYDVGANVKREKGVIIRIVDKSKPGVKRRGVEEPEAEEKEVNAESRRICGTKLIEVVAQAAVRKLISGQLTRDKYDKGSMAEATVVSLLIRSSKDKDDDEFGAFAADQLGVYAGDQLDMKVASHQDTTVNVSDKTAENMPLPEPDGEGL